MKRFWEVMTELYGNQWLSVHKLPTERWAKAIVMNPIEKVKQFLEECEAGKIHLDFPPTPRHLNGYCAVTNVPYHKPFAIEQDRGEKSTPEFVEALLKENGIKIKGKS